MFKTSIIIAEKDDIFYSLKDYKTIIIKDKFNINEFMEIYNNYKDNNNIIIDSRLIEIIIYAVILYDVSIYIYNVNNSKIDNIFRWIKNIFHINPCSFNIKYIKHILFLFIFVNYYLKPYNIRWNTNYAIKCVEQNMLSYFDITTEYIINYINIPITTNDTDTDLLKVCIEDIQNIFKLRNLKHIKQLNKQYNINLIQTALKQLSTVGVSLTLEN